MGELARAFAALHPEDEATREAIAALVLGPTAEASPVPPSRKPPSSFSPPPDGRSAVPPPPVQVRPPEVPEGPAGVPVPVNIKLRRNQLPSMPDWLSTAPPLPAPPPPGVTVGVPAPLLEPHRARAILGSLVAAPGDGPLDIEAILRSIALGRALASPPYRLVPTLARGVQLLVDRSDAMLPFHLDVEGLERELVRLAGGGVEVLHFVACPSRGCGRGVRRRWTPYGPERVPRLGARVLCVTDLGIGGPPPGDSPAQAEEWMAFAGELRRAGCSVAALVPYPPERWPPDVGRVMELFHWDRSLTVAQAARGVRHRR
ncbi:hypothetical protein [Hyalangium sp.]|uniref:hypothetical protein n=1 Tax=Hyalangium sp. TaxID=2028555 RepID=UPI002D4B46A8|nr:hypothetical protein [Hyalangium sp.]HYH98952.1 hypothetical protein [Hyalangium sp.]